MPALTSLIFLSSPSLIKEGETFSFGFGDGSALGYIFIDDWSLSGIVGDYCWKN